MSQRLPGRAVFRLEWDREVGLGHLARCSALAEELGRRGWSCSLWTNGDPSGAPTDLLAPFERAYRLDDGVNFRPPAVTREADWIVVDDYGADDAALRELAQAAGSGNRTAAARLLVVDDEGRRGLDAAALVVNARPGLNRSPYATGVPTLLGERFALLRTGLTRPKTVANGIPSGAVGVLVMLGGTDPLRLAPVVLDALADVDASRFCPVVPRSRPDKDADRMRHALARFVNSVPLAQLSAANLAGWAECCRFAISASGGTLYELDFLRLPFVAVVAAQNQRALAAAVAERWKMPVAWAGDNLRGSVAEAFASLVEHRSVQGGDSSPRRHIDGRGAQRIADAMEGIN